MIRRVAFMLFSASILFGCGMVRIPGSNDRDPIIKSIQWFDDVPTEERLRAPAFEVLRGMTTEEAVEELEKSGWTCQIRSCTTFTGRRDPIIELGVNPPGPRRDIIHYWTLVVPDGEILSPDQFEVRFRDEVKDTPIG